MTKLTETERLVAVETNLANLTKTVEEGFKELKDSIKGVNERFDRLTPTLVTEAKHTEDIADLRKEINEIKGKRWVQNTLSAIFGSVMALLVAYFISNVGR